MKHLTLVVAAVCTLAAGCSIRTERVVEKPATERTVVYDTATTPTTTTVYTTR